MSCGVREHGKGEAGVFPAGRMTERKQCARKIPAAVLSWCCGLLVLLVVAQQPARAQSCNFTVDNIDFGDVDLASGQSYTVTATLNVTCWGTANRWVIFCPNINAGSGGVGAGGDPRYMTQGTTRLNYNLYRPGTSTIWGSYVWPHPPRPPVFGIYLRGSAWFGFASGSTTIEARIQAGQTNLPAGDYYSTFGSSETYFEYDYYDSGVWCGNMPSPSVAHPYFQVHARNVSACSVSATDLDFGTVGVLNAPVDTTNTISVQCTAGTNYQIGLSGGNAGTTDPTQRKMSNNGREITYGIYSDAARTQGWGDTLDVNTVSGTGNGSTQNYTGYGRVPAQPTPPAGTYTDTIIVTLTY